jgi:hypothetical protein
VTPRRRRLTAGAWIGRQDQLEVSRKPGMHFATAKGDHAGLERRTQRLEDSRLELGSFLA